MSIPGIASGVKGSAVMIFVLWAGKRTGDGAEVFMHSMSTEEALQ